MKPINFVNSGSYKKHHKVRHWCLVSLTLFLCTLCATAAFSWVQWDHYCNLYENKKTVMAQLKNFDSTMTSLHEKRAQQMTFKSSQIDGENYKNPAALIKHIVVACKDRAQLESLVFDENQLEVKIRTSTANALAPLTSTLSGQPSCKGICLTALESTDNNQIIAILKTQKSDKRAT